MILNFSNLEILYGQNKNKIIFGLRQCVLNFMWKNKQEIIVKNTNTNEK